MNSYGVASSFEASNINPEDFYTPPTSHHVDLIRINTDDSDDVSTPRPSHTGGTSQDCSVFQCLDCDTIRSANQDGAFPDVVSATANPELNVEAFVEEDITERQLVSPENPATPVAEVARPQCSTPRALVRQDRLKRKRISTGELASLDRPPKRPNLIANEHIPLEQGLTSPLPPAQLITPSDTSIERSARENAVGETSLRRLTAYKRDCVQFSAGCRRLK